MVDYSSSSNTIYFCTACVSYALHSGYMRDGLDGGGRFIPADIVGVHTLSLLASSRVAHDHATEHICTQHDTRK